MPDCSHMAMHLELHQLHLRLLAIAVEQSNAVIHRSSNMHGSLASKRSRKLLWGPVYALWKSC